ncbi:MAG: hypothetical protein AAF591_07675 [Verrucomicrobiota bacterium]
MNTLAVRLVTITPLLTCLFATHALNAEENDRHIKVSAKFIESKNEFLANNKTLNRAELENLLRKFNREKGTSILTTPAVTAKSGQRTKIEVVREIQYPAGRDEKTLNLETIEAGITLELEAFDNQKELELFGKAIIRESDEPDQGREIAFPSNKSSPNALSFNTTETIFQSNVRFGDSLLLVCRRNHNIQGNLIILLTPELVVPTRPTKTAQTRTQR